MFISKLLNKLMYESSGNYQTSEEYSIEVMLIMKI